jgi:hypothetical protein
MRPRGAGSRNNGLQQVDVEYDGGPTRQQVELGWRPARWQESSNSRHPRKYPRHGG